MVNIGIWLSVGKERGVNGVYDVEELVIDKFKLKQRPTGLKVYKLIEVGNDELVSESEKLVVVCPSSKLSCDTVESIINQNNGNEMVIKALKNEVNLLQNRFNQSDHIREEALGTVNQLRNEFIHLIEEISPRAPVAATNRERFPIHARPVIEPVASTSRTQRSVFNRLIPRLGLSNLRK